MNRSHGASRSDLLNIGAVGGAALQVRTSVPHGGDMNAQERINGSSQPTRQPAVGRGEAQAENLWLGYRMDAPASARGWIRQICSRHGLDDLIDDAALLVSEVVTDAVLHAHSGCIVTAAVDPRAIRVSVVKRAYASEPSCAQDEYVGSEPGLAVVAALADDWGVTARDTGRTVWFTLARPNP